MSHFSSVLQDTVPKILGRREDQLAWYLRVMPDISELPNERTYPNGIEFAFPKSNGFIARLNKPETNRLIKHGWDLPKTLLLEIPYVMGFVPFFPAQAAAWLVVLQEKDVFFKVAVFCRGYVSSAVRIDLEDTILHEKDHLLEGIKKGLEGRAPHEGETPTEVVVNTQNEEMSEMLRTFEKLSRKYGFEETARQMVLAKQQAAERLLNHPYVFSSLMESWLWNYCGSHSEELREFAEPLPRTMKGENWREIPLINKETATLAYRLFIERDAPEDL